MQFPFQFRDLLQGGAQRDQITCVARDLTEPTNRALDIAHRFQTRPQRPEQLRFVQQIRDHLLPAFQLGQVAQRLQNPAPQFPRAHRRDRAVERGQQAHIARPAGRDQLQVRLRGEIEHHMRGRNIAAQRSEVIDLPPQLVLQIMDDRSRRGDRLPHLRRSRNHPAI